MELSSAAKVALIMNNYFHDVATAVLLTSAVVLWALGRRAAAQGGEAQTVLEMAYPALSKFALGAVAWIVIGGIPRTIFFAQLEWDPALQRGLVAALIVKHIFFAVVIGLGGAMWLRIRRMVRTTTGGPAAAAAAAE